MLTRYAAFAIGCPACPIWRGSLSNWAGQAAPPALFHPFGLGPLGLGHTGLALGRLGSIGYPGPEGTPGGRSESSALAVTAS